MVCINKQQQFEKKNAVWNMDFECDREREEIVIW